MDAAPEGLAELNLFKTVGKYPDLAKHFVRFGSFLLYRGLLPAREREIVILRTGWRSGSVYEFGQHTSFGARAGLGPDEIRRLTTEGAEGFGEGDRHLVAMVDDLCATNTVGDALWARLVERWSEAEMMELLMLAGYYRLVSGFLNATGVQLEPGTPGWPS